MIQEAASIVLREELERVKQEIIKNHIAAGQRASGRTAASLRVEANETEGTLWGRSPFGTLETGRQAGKVPANFRLIIRQWMQDKGIKARPMPYKTNRPHKYTAEERGELSLAFLIARKIEREGTSLFRKGGRNDIYTNVIPLAKERILMRITSLLKTEIKNIKLTNIDV
nr:MAG TPA: hypothetical protein [Caudoviricetes sp.]DAX54989.1 MAG TPA: hypothetical protein [Caudoviricetes sp.]